MNRRHTFRIFSAIIVLFIATTTFAQSDYYWVGGSGEWSDYSNHWATSSGGTTFHSQVPSSDDNVFFDENSFTSANQQVTLDVNASIHSMDWSAVPVEDVPTFSNEFGSTGLTLFGSLDFGTGVTFALNNRDIRFSSSDPDNIISGISASVGASLIFDGTGAWQIDATLVLSDYNKFEAGSGSFTFEDASLEALEVEFYDNVAVDLGSSTVTTSVWRIYNSATLTATSATISIVDIQDGYNYAAFEGGSFDYGTVALGSAAPCNFYGSNSFNFLSISAGSNVFFGSAETQTIGNLTIAGSESNVVAINSTNSGNLAFLNVSAADLVEWALISNIQANITSDTGGNLKANNSFDLGNNLGWDIIAPTSGEYFYWVGDTGYWSEVANWSSASGGTADKARVPTPADTVIFDINSFSTTDQVVTFRSNIVMNSMTWNNTPSGTTLSNNSTGSSITVLGSLATGGTSFDLGGANIYFSSQTENNSLTFDNSLINASMTFLGEGGASWNLGDNLVLEGSNTFRVSSGTVDADNAIEAFQVEVTGTGELNLNATSVKTTRWSYYGGSVGVTNSTITIDDFDQNNNYYEFYGSNGFYSSVVLAAKNGTINVYGENTIDDLQIGAGADVELASFSKQFISNSLSLNGSESSVCKVSSGTSDAAGAFEVSADPTVNWAMLKNVEITNPSVGTGYQATANNSFDLGGNSGWSFNAPTGEDFFWVGGAGSWSDFTNHWVDVNGDPATRLPYPADNVIFNENSFTADDQQVLIDMSIAVNDFSLSTVTFTPSFSSETNDYDITLLGSLDLGDASLNLNYNDIHFSSIETGNTIALGAGFIYANFLFDGTGEWGFEESFSLYDISYIRVESGTLNTNDVDIEAYSFEMSADATVNLASSTIKTTRFINSGALIDAGTSEIVIDYVRDFDENAEFYGGSGVTYNDVTFIAEGGQTALYGSNTFNAIEVGPGVVLLLEAGSSQVTSNFVASGDPTNVIQMGSTVTNSLASLVQDVGEPRFYASSIRDIEATGEVTFVAINSQDFGGNEGIVFDPVPDISSFSPLNGASNVDITENIVITFDQAVTAGTGSLRIWDGSDTEVEAIDISAVNVTTDGTSFTFDPLADLLEDQEYYITVDAGIVEVVGASSFVGFSSPAFWRFDTYVSNVEFEADSLALVELYNSTNGDSWLNNSNWLVGTLDSWFGVTVLDGRVVALDLSDDGTFAFTGNGLSGYLPESLGNLTNLTYLNVNANNIYGGLPSTWGNWESITQLSLRDNQMSGSIPDGLGNLLQLEILELAGNGFSGSIPDEIADLSSLRELWLSENQFTGDLPAGIDGLTSLEVLSVSSNRFTSLPDLTSLPLNTLDIEINNFFFADFEDYSAIITSGYSQNSFGDRGYQFAEQGDDISLSFDVEVSGSGNDVYQWRLDGIDIPGTNSSTYTFTAAEGTFGRYTLHISNTAFPGVEISSEEIRLEEGRVVSANITTDEVWNNDIIHVLDGRIFVEPGANLEIEAGAVIKATQGHVANNEIVFVEGSFTNWEPQAMTLVADHTWVLANVVFDGGSYWLRNSYWSYEETFADTDCDGIMESSNDTGYEYTYCGQIGTFDLVYNDDTQVYTLEDAGTISDVGSSFLAVAKGATITAEGTAENPIVFTSVADDIEIGASTGTELYVNDRSLWGGLIVFGSAPISDIEGVGEAQFEGIPSGNTLGLFGGSSADDRSGSLKYISIRHGGASIGEGNQVNGLTLAGVGSATEVDNIEVIGAYDDGIEWFGGTVNVTNALVGYVSDDALDTDLSYGGTLDNFVVIRPKGAALELDGPEGAFENGGGLLTNGTIKDIERGPLIDLDADTDASISNLYFFNLDNASAVEDYDLYSANTNGYAISSFEATLPDGTSLEDLFPAGADAQVTEVLQLENTTGADPSVFYWTYAFAIGELGIFGVEVPKMPVEAQDSLALVALYNATNGSEWFNNFNWLQPDQFVEDWYGVEVQDNRVVSLDLAGNNLSGSLPAEIGDLTALLSLNFGRESEGGNNIAGAIPTEIGNLVVLERMGLANNQFSGPIPTEIGNMTALEKIDLAFNQLDELPASFGNLTNLTYAGIAYNNFTSLPLELYDMPSVDTLLISGNALTGAIPPELGSMSTLTFLNIGDNDFEGQLPPELGNLTNLLGLRIWDMPGITGEIPAEWAGLTSIQEFSLTNLSLEGELPAFIGDFSEVELIYLYYNQFSGTVPESFQNLENLSVLNLYGNALDSIYDLTSLPSLGSLSLGNNRFLWNELLINESLTVENNQHSRYSLEVLGDAAAGGTITLTVSSDRAENGFVWLKDGEELDGETGDVLTLTDLSEADRGMYTCIVNSSTDGGFDGIPSESYSLDLNEEDRRYAASVISATSEAKSIDFSAREILGVPNHGTGYYSDGTLVDGAENLESQERGWAADGEDESPVIELGFDAPAPINTIWLYGDGTSLINSIEVKDEDTGDYTQVVDFAITPSTGFESEVNFPTTTFDVSELRISLSQTSAFNQANGLYTSIDAVAIGDNGLQVNTPSSVYLSEVVTDTIINIGWTQANFNDTTAFVVARSTDDITYVDIAEAGNFVRYSDRDAPKADSVYYKVKAVVGEFESEYSEALLVEKCDVALDIPAGSYTGISTELSAGYDPDGGFADDIRFSDNGDGTIAINNFWANYLDDSSSPATLSGNCDGSINVEASLNSSCESIGVSSINVVEFFPANDSLVIEFTFDCGYDIQVQYIKNAGDPIAISPSGLTAHVASSGSVMLSWIDNSTFETEWVVERSEDDITYTEVATVVPNPQVEITGNTEYESYLDESLTTGTTYYYRIVARNGSGDSEPSEAISITVNDPVFTQMLAGDLVDDLPTNSYGGAWGDFDADGDQDLYVTNWYANSDPFAVTKENYLYENDGNGLFSRLEGGDIAELEYTSRGSFWADYDNDGNLDLLVNGTGSSSFIDDSKNYLFTNTGAGTFTTNALFDGSSYNSGVADFDLDGDLDIFTSSNQLHINNGDGTYTEQKAEDHTTDGSEMPFGWTYLTPDFNNDGLPDLVVSGDDYTGESVGGFIHLYENAGGLKFSLVYQSATIVRARGATYGDYDGNGFLDVIVTGNFGGAAVLLLNDGANFNEVVIGEADNAGAFTPQRGITTLDYDNDGDEDLIWLVDDGRPYIFENDGDANFTRMNEASPNFGVANAFSQPSVADVNGDGFMDVFVAHSETSKSNQLFLNNGNGNSYLKVKLASDISNAVGLGSKVRVKVDDTWRVKQVNNSNGLFSGNEMTVHFGLGAAVMVDSVEVYWTSGNVTQKADVLPNQTLLINEDLVPPVVAVDVKGTSVRSPEVTGTIDDLEASLNLTIDGTVYTPEIAGDGTWSLPEGTITPDLPDGTYDVVAEATDVNGNVGTDEIADELTITQELEALVASEITSTSFKASWSEALDVQSYLLDVATDVDFTSFVEGYESFTTTGQNEVIDGLDFSTNYYYRVRFINTASETSDYSDTTELVTSIDEETIRDFEALEAIYNATGGESWVDQGGWTTSTVLQDWSFIGFDETRTRVDSINLSGNGLTGTFPLTDSLTALAKLIISNNELQDLEDLSELPSLTDLDVSGNSLGFDDLEPLSEIVNFAYGDQSSISFVEASESDSLLVRVFTDTTLSISTGGDHLQFKWFLDDVEVDDPEDFIVEDSVLRIVNIDYENMGKFKAEVSNDILTGLTIDVDSMFVFAVADFSVDVNDPNSGELIEDEVDGFLLLTTQVEKGFDTLSVAQSQPSSFTFEDVILGDYLISIDSDPEKYVPTYYSDAFEWIEADTVEFRRDTAFQVSMTFAPDYQPLPEDVGLLAVTIEEDFGEETEAGRIEARRRAARRKCGLRQRTRGGRTGQDEDEWTLFAYGETDDQGEFEFGFLPQGTYRFFVEYPGIPLTDEDGVEFEVGESGISDTEFKLEAFVTEEGIEVTIENVLGVILDYFKDLEVYPNPADDLLNVKYRHLKAKNVAAQLVDVTGQVLWTTDMKEGFDGTLGIDVSSYENGVYLLHFYDKESREDQVVTYQIIVRH